MFATSWSGFHKFSRGPSLMRFFTSSPTSGWTRNFRLDYIELPWVSLNITVGWVRWPRVVILSSMAENYVDEFYDCVLWYWVLWPWAMLTSFITACCDIEFHDREVCCRVLWPRVVMLSFMTACYDVEWVGRMPKCRVSWPRAKNDAKMSRQFRWFQP